LHYHQNVKAGLHHGDQSRLVHFEAQIFFSMLKTSLALSDFRHSINTTLDWPENNPNLKKLLSNRLWPFRPDLTFEIKAGIG